MKFIAEDGQVFETMEACEAHEKDLAAKADAQKALMLQQAKDLKELNDAKRHYEELLKNFKEKYRPEEKKEEDAPRKASVQMTFFDDDMDEEEFDDEFDEDDDDDCGGCCGDGDCDECEYCHGCDDGEEVLDAMNELVDIFERVFGI